MFILAYGIILPQRIYSQDPCNDSEVVALLEKEHSDTDYKACNIGGLVCNYKKYMGEFSNNAKLLAETAKDQDATKTAKSLRDQINKIDCSAAAEAQVNKPILSAQEQGKKLLEIMRNAESKAKSVSDQKLYCRVRLEWEIAQVWWKRRRECKAEETQPTGEKAKTTEKTNANNGTKSKGAKTNP